MKLDKVDIWNSSTKKEQKSIMAAASSAAMYCLLPAYSEYRDILKTLNDDQVWLLKQLIGEISVEVLYSSLGMPERCEAFNKIIGEGQ